MQETPEIMVISNALEQPAGKRATRCAVCLGAVAGTFLSAARRPQTATKVACVALMFTCIVTDLTVCRCSRSLLRTINESLLHKSSAAADKTSHRSALGNADRETGGRPDDLLVARKNIRIATSLCLVLGVGTVAVLAFSVSSPLGMTAPLLFFATPMVRPRLAS